MYNALPHKTKQFFFVLIKLSIVLAAFYFIYYKLAYNDALNISSFIGFLYKNHIFSAINVLVLLILSILNWFFEVLKWRMLATTIKKISFKNALEQSLGALTASLFTPNRIGEYGAKAIYFAPHLRKRIMLVNIIGNTLQMVITTLLGLVGFSFYILKYNPNLNYNKLIIILILLLLALVVICFIIKKTNFNIKGFSFKKTLLFFKQFPKNKLTLSFILAIIRYAIFSFQFYVLLNILKINLSYLDTMVIITSMYLLASIIPSIFIFDVVIKGSIAVYLFSLAGVNEFVILCIITTMWILNFVIPSIFGSYYVLNFNHLKHLDNT